MTDDISKHDPKDSIKAIAMNIGKNVANYVEWVFPEAVEAASSSFLISIRNSIYNEIMSAMTSDTNAAEQLALDEKHRRHMRKYIRLNKKKISFGER